MSQTFAKMLGIQHQQTTDNTATLALTITEQHLNGGGFSHGGVTATLLDSTCGVACLHGRQGGVTLSLTTNYIAPAQLGDVLTCTATVTKRTKKMAFAIAEITNQNNQTIATATAVFRILSAVNPIEY